jgi:acetyl-CoA acetyltransferase
VELHDAFSVEEIFYLEAMGIARPGEAPAMLRAGAFDIGGDVSVSPSGGLLAMGHPIGPTGAGQIVEITRQLRGEAGARQHPNARVGLAHMVGVGAVCVVHVLARN